MPNLTPNLKDKTVFVDVDTQADFMLPEGKLYVPGAEKLVANLARLMAYARQHDVAVVSSTDAHAADDPEFQQFPPHCVEGTAGQQKLPQTLLPARQVVRNDGSPLPGGEKFAGCRQWVVEKQAFNMFTNANCAALLERLDAERYVVFGVATEYCVRAAVLGLLRLGRPVEVVTDAIQGIAPAASKAALQEMQDAGAEFVDTETILSETVPG